MKRNLLCLAVFVIAMLISFEGYSQIAVKTGQFSFSSDDPGNIGRGKIGGKAAGQRSATKEIKFNTSFEAVPRILISVNSVDIRTSDVNLRYKIEPKYISKNGFVIELLTWYDSEILMMGGTWMAISEN
ncbi:MAG: H-type lectin domain-containing protein [Ekhidna sp.]|nr:H-type lectin domain-containing protein [Ekhidna sp.]MBC6409829.1 H-type lectin domain-containing protein [Ekhidna sp.]